MMLVLSLSLASVSDAANPYSDPHLIKSFKKNPKPPETPLNSCPLIKAALCDLKTSGCRVPEGRQIQVEDAELVRERWCTICCPPWQFWVFMSVSCLLGPLVVPV